MELPSSEEISRIVVKHNVAYKTSPDGYLFGIKLDYSMDALEMNEIIFEDTLTNSTKFPDLSVSPKGVHMTFILKNNFAALKPDKKVNNCSSEIMLVRMIVEKDVLSILMDDNKLFSCNQDPVEEIRHLYFNNKHLLQKLSKNKSRWEASTLHNLQLASTFACSSGTS